MPLTRFAGAAVASCTATVLTAAIAGTPAHAATVMTLSSTSGPSGGGNSITGTVTATAANPSPFPAGTLPRVQFQYVGAGSNSCSAAPRAVAAIQGSAAATTGGVLTVDPAEVSRLTATKIVFTVPSSPYPADVDGQPSTVNPTGLALAAGQTTAKWNVCVYDENADTLIANAPYTLAVRPRITSIVPASSPALGGKTVTINGAGFSASGTSVTIGGTAAKDVKVSPGGSSLTVTTPPRTAATGLTVAVATTGGTVLSSDPDNNEQPQDNDPATADAPILFTYSNGIAISPDTAPARSTVSVEIRAMGLDALTFDAGAAPTGASAHVFLVRDAYEASTNRGVQECGDILAVSKTEMVCTLDLSSSLDPSDSSAQGSPVPEGTYTMTVVANGSTSATPEEASPSIVSSDATFTVGPY
ncbi:IPT/TIG domain-containing protein [Actinoplanes sp. NPDC048796]|uniref:IPT/TIG domain-containing protein n=1 Tax=Actinoplanes sp. NPDC048796 TaxID=3155640 RepID=UPI0033E04355